MKKLLIVNCSLFIEKGGLAQLARAPALHAGCQRFESVILHEIDEKWKMKNEKINH